VMALPVKIAPELTSASPRAKAETVSE